MFKFFLQFVACAGIFVSAGIAPAVVIEGFESTADPGNWQATSPSPQTLNATNSAAGSTPVFSTAHVTEGTRSGEFVTTWTISSPVSASNPHMSGGPGLYWAIRYNVNAPGSLTGNAISPVDGLIQADVFNANPYPLSMAIICDTASNAGLERGPFIEFAPNSSGVYSWNLGTTPPVPYITGDGTFAGQNARLKTIILYTETQPTVEPSSFFIDNIQNLTAQADVEAPAVPVPYSAKQGPAAGQLVVTWQANTEADLAGYNVYMATDADFGNPTINRLAFLAAPAGTTAAGVNTITLTGVPTDQNVYVQVRAFDNAMPNRNESSGGIALGVRLRSDGGAVDDHVILDLDRNLPNTSEFALEGYAHDIAYNARALSALNRYFDSATADAVDSGAETLAASSTGITIWSNLLDGNSTSSVALSNESVAALTTFLAANGNLFISGSGVAEDLSSRGPAQQAFLATQLLASLVNPNTADGNITATPPLASFGTAITTANNFANISAYSATSNEQLAPLGGATATGQYGISSGPDAGIVHSNKVVFLGYAFESAAGADSGTSELVRQQLLQDVVNYLLGSPVHDWQLY